VDARKTTSMLTRAFISYRRDSGGVLARLVKEALEHGGCDAFLDVDDLGPGHYDRKLLVQIEERPNFVLLCTPGALDRCGEVGDFLQMEIARALQTGRNIVPLVVEGFEWPSEKQLPDAIRDLPRHNDVQYSHRHWESTRGELVRRMRGERRPFRITLETDPARFEACKEVLEKILASLGRHYQIEHEIVVRLLEPRPTSATTQLGLEESLKAADLLLVDVASPLREQMLFRAGLAIGLGIDVINVSSNLDCSQLHLPDGFPQRWPPSLAVEWQFSHEHLKRHIAECVQRKFR